MPVATSPSNPAPAGDELTTSTAGRPTDAVLADIVASLRCSFAENYADAVLSFRAPELAGPAPLLEDIAAMRGAYTSLAALRDDVATVAAELWAVKTALAEHGITVPTLIDMLGTGEQSPLTR